VVGLVGGTGVGKSTLINALAGGRNLERAATAGRRLTASVVYRHKLTQLPGEFPRGDLSEARGPSRAR